MRSNVIPAAAAALTLALALVAAPFAQAALKGAKDPATPGAHPPLSLPTVVAAAPSVEDSVPAALAPLPASVATTAPELAEDQPSVLLRLSPLHKTAVVVDLAKARLYVFENTPQGLRIVRQHYAAMGKNGFGKQARGDNRTPLGVYSITGYTPSSLLPDFYGAGAFPLNYPNDWDFHRNRTGSGIWLHGVPPNTYARAPRSSEGCVTMANDDLTALRAHLKAGETPVVLADQLDWVSGRKLAASATAIAERIEAWRAKWSAIDTPAYLDFYAADFTSAGLDKAGFTDYKNRVNASKKRIDVTVRDLDLYAYPGERDLVLAEFTQDYDSDNYRVTNRKQQYWKKQADGGWKIVLEESR